MRKDRSGIQGSCHQDSRCHGEHRSWVAPFSLFLVLLVMDCFLNCKRKASSSLQPGCPSSRWLSKSQKELHDQPATPESAWEKVEFGGFCFFPLFLVLWETGMTSLMGRDHEKPFSIFFYYSAFERENEKHQRK